MRRIRLCKQLSLALLLLLISTLSAQVSFLRERVCTASSQSGYELTQLAQRGQLYGHCLRMPIGTDQLSAAYYVKESVTQASPYHQLASVIGKEERMLITSAGFTVQNYDRPLGLCVAGGKIVNYRISQEMDGIVLIENGNLQVFNRQESIVIASLGSGYLKDTSFKTRFLNWAEGKQASVFQTHLLVLDNELLISISARLKPAFRKILAQAVSAKGEPSIFLFYVQQGTYLYDASKVVFDHLQRKDYSIDFMINLDTGAHDVLQLQDGADSCFGQEISGFSNTFSSSNLLVFYRP